MITPNMTKTCEFCGRELEPFIADFAGRSHVIGYKECDCDGAREKREQDERDEEQRERDKRAEEYTERLKHAGIPPAYMTAKHPAAKELAEKIEPGHGLFISGGQGTCKTVLAVAIGKIFAWRGTRLRFEVAAELAQALRTFETEDQRRYDQAASAPLLILDDLDKVAATPYACERIFSLINYRYNYLLPTIITANVSRGQIGARFANGEAGKAIASRLHEMTETYELRGPDQRLNHDAR